MIEEEDEQEIPLGPADPSVWPGAEPKQAAFLTALVNSGGTRKKAAKAAKVSRASHYRWHGESETYRALFKEALVQAGHALEDAATERCMTGVPKGIYFQGRKVATERVYPEGMTMFLLRGIFPDKYRERTEHTGKDGGPIESKIEVVFVTKPKE